MKIEFDTEPVMGELRALLEKAYLQGVLDTLESMKQIEVMPSNTPCAEPLYRLPAETTSDLRVKKASEDDNIEQKILATIRALNAEGASFNQHDLSVRAGLKYTPVAMFMGSLRRRGLIRKIGSPRSDRQHWIIIAEHIAASPTAPPAQPKSVGRPAARKPFRRFTDVAAPDPENVLVLAVDHPAMIGRRTIFTSTVVDAADSPRLLVSGGNSRKLGDRVVKGRWKGMPLYQLTLEERATCSDDCELLGSCYGNGMHLARRHRYSPVLVERLAEELSALAKSHQQGFVVRLHTLGDFPDADYVRKWGFWIEALPQLNVFGYTHWPRDSEIGLAIAELTGRHWDRFAIRFSGLESGPQTAVTIWRKPEAAVVAEGIVCPAETGRTACCGTCGLCWAARDRTIVFIGHGPKPRTGKRTEPKSSYGAPRNPLKSSTQSDPVPPAKRPDSGEKRPIQAQTRPERPIKAHVTPRSVSQSRPERHVTTPTRLAPTARSGRIDVKAAVDAYLAKGGKITVVDNTMTGDPWALKAYLERKGHHIRAFPQTEKPWVVDGKTTIRSKVLDLVNRHRADDGLAPIPGPKP